MTLSLPLYPKVQAHSRMPECDGRTTVQVKQSPFNRMAIASAGVQTDLSKVVHSLCRSICHSSEIHAWVANKIFNLGQWEKVALIPSSDFIVKNQLAREGSQSVSPVNIPALTTIVDRQFKEDRTLCPVQALRYYLDRTKDLTGFHSLLFISFKKGHTSDIRPAALSSWLTQTIPQCDKQANQQSLDLVQVKLMILGPSQPPRPFYGEVSDQIIQACHWKALNTFTIFLPKRPWSDKDNLYLGPVD